MLREFVLAIRRRGTNQQSRTVSAVRPGEQFVQANHSSADVHIDLLETSNVVVLFKSARDPRRISLCDDDEARFHAGFDLDTRCGKAHLACVFERHADSLRFLFGLGGEELFRIDTLDDVNHEGDMHGANRRLGDAVTARGIFDASVKLAIEDHRIVHESHPRPKGLAFQLTALLLVLPSSLRQCPTSEHLL